MADLPSGAVTFLFTDIEGSTRLVRQLRDRYGEVLGYGSPPMPSPRF
jgi:class 3 adenylate cyclase